MDNLTHSFVGLVAAKTGLERFSPGATPVCVLAANAPDSDIVVLLLSDRWSFLQHHRGITHAIVGTLFFSIALPLLFVLIDSLIARCKHRARIVNFRGLLIVSLIASATHPLLDWTNNYGIRFFLPWSNHWSYGDLVYIVDPFLWLIFGGTAFLLTRRTRFLVSCWSILWIVLTLLVMMSSRSLGASNPWVLRSIWLSVLIILVVLFLKKGVPLERSYAFIAIVLACLYWGSLWTLHRSALRESYAEAQTLLAPHERIVKLATMPSLANPFKWDCVFETTLATYRFPIDLLTEAKADGVVRYQTPDPALTRALTNLSGDRRLRIFEGFARFPVAQFEDASCTTQTIVQFADLRYTEPGRSRGTFSLELPVDCPDEHFTK